MDILEDINVLKVNDFWNKIALADINSICSYICKEKKDGNYINALADFFYELTSSNIGEDKIYFCNKDINDILSPADCILLYKNIDKIENIYIKALFLSYCWQYKKLPASNDNFKAVIQSLQLYLDIVDNIFIKVKKFKDNFSEVCLIRIFDYCLYTSCSIKDSIFTSFIKKLKEVIEIEYTQENSFLILGSIKVLIKHSNPKEIYPYFDKFEDWLIKTDDDYVKQDIYDIAISVAKEAKDKEKREGFLKRKADMLRKMASEANNVHYEISLLRQASMIYRDIPDCRQDWENISKEIERKSPQKNEMLMPISFTYRYNRYLIEETIESVKNKTFKDCLKQIAYYISYLPSEDQVEQCRYKEGIISDFLPAEINDEKGFTTAVIDTDKKQYPYSFYLSLGEIWLFIFAHILQPMFARIKQEHFFTYNDLTYLCNNNLFIPKDREIIFAKGLYSFLDMDMLMSSVLLVPQLENSFRELLYGYEIITKERKDGRQEYKIEMKWLLDKLFEKKILSKKIYFNLDRLLCDNFYNIRNNIAHGLFGQNDFEKIYVVILNWIIFYLVYIGSPLTYHNNLQTGSSSQ